MIAETFNGGQKTSMNCADLVEVSIIRDYGCVSIKIDKDKIYVESQDGGGDALEKREFVLDDLVGDAKSDDGTEFRDELKILDHVQQTLTEAGIGEQPNPLAHEPEGQEAGGQEEGAEEAGGGGRPEGQG